MGPVKVMAGLIVTERDKGGLRLEKYRPFPLRGARVVNKLDRALGGSLVWPESTPV